MYLSTEKGNSAVQNKRRILYVPMKVDLKIAVKLYLQAAKHLDENWKKKITNYLDIGKYFSVIIKMPGFIAN